MAMTKRLWSISALATELDADRRTIARKLASVAPDGRLNGKPAWFLATALLHLAPANGTGRQPPDKSLPPLGMEPLSGVQHRHVPLAAGMLIATYATGRIVAAVSAANGAAPAIAKNMARQVTGILWGTLSDELVKVGLDFTAKAPTPEAFAHLPSDRQLLDLAREGTA
jgi:hypothetical protein